MSKSTLFCNVLLYNIFTPILEPARQYGQTERLKRIPETIQTLEHQPDVIVICEVIPDKYIKILTSGLRKVGYTFYTKPIRSLLPASGGVIIFSKHKIIEQKQFNFMDLCLGNDCFASKGIIYAKIEMYGRNVNVFGTHLQAWTSEKAMLIREKQVSLIRTFIDSRNIPKHEPVILAGDLNIDLYSNRHHLDHIMNHYDFDIPIITEDSLPYTFDPINNILVGSDEPERYANLQYPNGCEKEYYDTLSCVCCTPEWLDYILTSSTHLKPIKSTMKIIMLKTKTPFNMNIKGDKVVQSSDLSDHFPLLAQLEFPHVDEKDMEYLKTAENTCKEPSSGFAVLMIVTMVLIPILLLICLYTFYIIWKRNKLYKCYREKEWWNQEPSTNNNTL